MIDWKVYYEANLRGYVLARWASGVEHLWDTGGEWGQWAARAVVPDGAWPFVPVVTPEEAVRWPGQ